VRDCPAFIDAFFPGQQPERMAFSETGGYPLILSRIWRGRSVGERGESENRIEKAEFLFWTASFS
jgi:hypothetical protein